MLQTFFQTHRSVLVRVAGLLLCVLGMCSPNAGYLAFAQGSAQYLGCFKDADNRDLKDKFWDDSRMTPERCLQSCTDSGYAYAGVQYGNQCFCGNSYGRYGKLSESSCNMTCSGDSGLVCGGTWANTLYKTASRRDVPPMVAPPPPPPPVRSSATPAATYLGCFRDTDQRDLNATQWDDGQMTPQRCIRTCADSGFEYAGLQYGSQCFCGNSHGRFGRIDSSSCSMPCSGNSGLMCGGTWANSVFRVR